MSVSGWFCAALGLKSGLRSSSSASSTLSVGDSGSGICAASGVGLGALSVGGSGSGISRSSGLGLFVDQVAG